MPTQSSAGEAASRPIPDERISVVSSATMHIRMLHAQLLFLKETGSVPKEMENMLSSLMATLLDSPAAVAQPQTSSPNLAHRVLNPPLTISVHGEYVTKTYRGVVANPGDRVVVFAWTNDRTEAIAYNPRNNTSGRIPADVLEKNGSEKCTDTVLHVATMDERHVTFGHVKWKEGDYVRTWKKENKRDARLQGFCFNLATGDIGKFACMEWGLDIID